MNGLSGRWRKPQARSMCGFPTLCFTKMAHVFRENHLHVQCVVRKTSRDVFVYDILPADKKPVIGGLAVDIGTTNGFRHSHEHGDRGNTGQGFFRNGQNRYGADVINRIIESQKPGGGRRLQKAVITETINPLIDEMCRSIQFPREQIYRMAVGRKYYDEHLLMGVDADPIRMEPYIPTFFKTNSLFASDIGIHIHPDAHIYVAPNIGSYVGGDITAGAFVSLHLEQAGDVPVY